MSGFGNLCRTIQARDKLSTDLASVELRLAGTQWYRWGQRRSLQQRATELRLKVEDRNAKISEEKVLELANYVGSKLWNRAASTVIPKKNTHGPAARNRFVRIMDAAIDLRKDYVEYTDGCSFPLTALPEIESVLTREFMAWNALRVIEDRAAIAASPEIIHKYDQDREGQKRLWVQHVASGLRALFFLHGDGFGGIESKSTKLGSIDHAKPGTLDWDSVERVIGLGIGRRIYEEAHRLEPDIRWGGGLLSEYSGPLRRRLHSADPYVWDWSSCLWCEANLRKQGIHHWRDAVPSSFSGHP